MTKPSEYMEAFFGVELNQKFEDMINELREIENNLKDLSKDIGKLSTESRAGRDQGAHQGVPGCCLRERPAD